MNEIDRFRDEVQDIVRQLGADQDMRALSRIWLREVGRFEYAYDFTWMSRPVIQFSQRLMTNP